MELYECDLVGSGLKTHGKQVNYDVPPRNILPDVVIASSILDLSSLKVLSKL